MTDQDTGGADTGDALQVEIEQAQAEGRDADAQALYQRQQGTTDPYGLEPVEPAEPAEPAVEDTEDTEDTEGDEAAAGDDADGEAAFVVPTRLEELMVLSPPDSHVAWDSLTGPEKDDLYERVWAVADQATATGILRREWPGEDYERNVEMAVAALVTVPGWWDYQRVLEAAGVADHPAIIRYLAGSGRLRASVPGDPATIPTITNTTSEAKMKQIDPDTFDERSTQLMEEASQARATGNRGKANRLQREIDALFKSQYGDEAAVGTSGGPTV